MLALGMCPPFTQGQGITYHDKNCLFPGGNMFQVYGRGEVLNLSLRAVPMGIGEGKRVALSRSQA